MILEQVIPTRYADAQVFARLQGVAQRFFYAGNFTVCVLQNGREILAVGVAKRNPNEDEPDTIRGEKIALVRAFRSLQK